MIFSGSSQSVDEVSLSGAEDDTISRPGSLDGLREAAMAELVTGDGEQSRGGEDSSSSEQRGRQADARDKVTKRRDKARGNKGIDD